MKIIIRGVFIGAAIELCLSILCSSILLSIANSKYDWDSVPSLFAAIALYLHMPGLKLLIMYKLSGISALIALIGPSLIIWVIIGIVVAYLMNRKVKNT